MADLDTLRELAGKLDVIANGKVMVDGKGHVADGYHPTELAALASTGIIALLDENERLRAVLTKLASEVEGVKARDIMVRGAIGNTNWGVLMLRLHEAREALAHP